VRSSTYGDVNTQKDILVRLENDGEVALLRQAKLLHSGFALVGGLDEDGRISDGFESEWQLNFATAVEFGLRLDEDRLTLFPIVRGRREFGDQLRAGYGFSAFENAETELNSFAGEDIAGVQELE